MFSRFLVSARFSSSFSTRFSTPSFRSFSTFRPSAARFFSSAATTQGGHKEEEFDDEIDEREVEYPVTWADFRPNLVEVEATRNSDGVLEGVLNGEKVLFPEMEPTLEFVLTTPVDLHLFAELPFVKSTPEDDPIGHHE